MSSVFKEYIRTKSKRLDEVFWKRFLINFESVLKKDYYPRYVEELMEQYNTLPGGPSDDPTALDVWEDVFRNHFNSQSVVNETIKVSSNGAEIGMGDREFLGFGHEGNADEPDPIIWMVYFIADTAAQGPAGRFTFISKEEYEKVRGEGTFNAMWGRFGKGFMLAKEDFEKEGWSEHLGGFAANEHPMSKMLNVSGPINIFEEAFNTMESSKYSIPYYVDVAIDRTLKDMEKVK